MTMRLALVISIACIFAMIVFLVSGAVTVVALEAIVGPEKSHVQAGNNWQTWVVCGVPATVTVMLAFPFGVIVRRMLQPGDGEK